MSEFKEKIDNAANNAIQEKSTGLFRENWNGFSRSRTDNERKIYNAKANIIKNFPIPSNKEDIRSNLLTFSTSQSNGITVIRNGQIRWLQ